MTPLLLVVLVSCKEQAVDYSFPEGLEPLEENTAAWPAGQAEEVSYVVGEEDEYHWAHARAYVNADIDAVYSCMRDEMVNVDRREIESWSTTPDVEDGYEFSYAIWNQTYPTLGVQVEYTDTWRHGSTLAEDGSTALARTSSERFAMIFVDLYMPGIDGLATIKRIRAQGCHEDKPIIVCTGETSEQVQLAALNAGATGILVKPIRSSALDEILGRPVSR
jgi:CheY-like chemotaxis protein